MTKSKNPASKSGAWQSSAAVFLLSAAVLAYEVFLLRLFAIVHISAFTSVIISLALLGFGYSGTVLFFVPHQWLREVKRQRKFFALHALAFIFTAVGGYYVVQLLDYYPGELPWSVTQHGTFTLLFLTLSLPFFFAASAIGSALMKAPPASFRVYFYDLLGAGCGAVVIVMSLTICTVTQSLGILCALAAMAAALAGMQHSRGRTTLLIALFLAALVYFLPRGQIFLSPYKDLSRAQRMPDVAILAEESGPEALVSMVASSTIPFHFAPGLSMSFTGELPAQLGVFVDGALLQALDRHQNGNGPRYQQFLPDALGYALAASDQAWLQIGLNLNHIGLAQAFSHGQQQLHIVESNKTLIRLLSSSAVQTWTGIDLHDPSLRLHSLNPRGFLAANQQAFALIDLPLAEPIHQRLLTREGLQVLRRNLAPDGLLQLTFTDPLPARLSLRCWLSLLEFFPPEQIVAIQSLSLITMVAKASAFSTQQKSLLEERITTQGFTRLSPPENGEALGPNYPFAVNPVDDDRPFVSDFVRPRYFMKWLLQERLTNRALLDVSTYSQWFALVVALAAGIFCIIVPLLLSRRLKLRQISGWKSLVIYFTAIGLGFMLVEVSLMEKLQLVLADNVYAMAVILGVFLFAAGIGALYSGSIAQEHSWRPLVGIAVYLAIISPLLDWIISRCLSHSPHVALLGALGVIAPLAFLMGTPFVLKLRTLSATPDAALAWGSNGCASVVGAIAASVLNHHLGFNGTLLIAAIFYGLCIVVIRNKAVRT